VEGLGQRGWSWSGLERLHRSGDKEGMVRCQAPTRWCPRSPRFDLGLVPRYRPGGPKQAWHWSALFTSSDLVVFFVFFFCLIFFCDFIQICKMFKLKIVHIRNLNEFQIFFEFWMDFEFFMKFKI
jgi:hypothetical protein